ncbi:MAG: hypothetical protein AMJ90_01330 [candidate division Zixibacteria bacterium SM23_73_2]|nr:MAG: hypothetical protein AMJ90_01330 [candidate division Zixibacteria bacterium SM23_73_2]
MEKRVARKVATRFFLSLYPLSHKKTLIFVKGEDRLLMHRYWEMPMQLASGIPILEASKDFGNNPNIYITFFVISEIFH